MPPIRFVPTANVTIIKTIMDESGAIKNNKFKFKNKFRKFIKHTIKNRNVTVIINNFIET